jgi:hypothetical protein
MQEDFVTVPQTAKNSRLYAVVETSLIGAGLLVSFLLIPHDVGGDGWVRFVALSELLERDKLPKMPYSMVGPLFSLPFWFLGKVYKTPLWWCERYNTFVFVIGLLVIYFLLRNQMDRSVLRKFLLILSVASMFPNHLLYYYAEVFTAVGVGVGILAVTVRRSFAGWIPVVLGVANTPASLLALGCMTLTKIVMDKRWRYIFVFVAAAGLLAAESWLLRGHPLRSGYEGNRGFQNIMPYSGRPGFSYPFFFGLISILFSFGKGLLFFAPGLLLPIKSTLIAMKDKIKYSLYTTYCLWISFLIGLVLVYAKWWAWYGGMFWGPRFFLFASLPASFALAVRLHTHSHRLVPNLLVALVLLLSMWVGINGAVFDLNSKGGGDLFRLCNANKEFLCNYIPEFSVLWYPFIHPLKTITQFHKWQYLYIAYDAIVFIYLATPLLRTIWRQTAELAIRYGKPYLNFKSWHF